MQLRDCSGKGACLSIKKIFFREQKRGPLETKVMIGEMRNLIEGLEDKVITFQEEDQKEKKDEKVEEER